MEAKPANRFQMDLKTKIEKVLSEILSDQHECKVTLRFENKNGGTQNDRNEQRRFGTA